ncbi:MAG: DUF3726 domain-containing protein [Sedimentitalea sp.]
MSFEPQDQTRGDSTPFFGDTEPAPLSCNEAASLCMKAARGAGMSWGMAEEAGFAAAWLVSHGIDGPSHMRAHLERADGRDWADLCPSATPGDWQNAHGQPACPIILGATMCDYADLPEGPNSGATVALGPVSAPILLVPFLVELAHSKSLAFKLSWPEGAIRIDNDETWLQAALQSLGVPQLVLTLSAKAAQPHKPSAASMPNAQTTAATIAALNAFAMRTTVPATEASRTGAGSTLSDND